MATRNPPVNQNVTTASPANTAGAGNVNIAGGSNATTSGANNAPAGGSPTWESGSGIAAATLTLIAPDTHAVNSGTFTLTCTGTNFRPTSVIMFAGTPLNTTYVSATSLTCTVNSVGHVAGVQTVGVQNGPNLTATQDFTWT